MLNVKVPVLAGRELKQYGDKKDGSSFTKFLKVNKKGDLKLSLQPNGGVMLVQEQAH